MRVAVLLLFSIFVPQLFLGVAATENSSYAYGLDRPFNAPVLQDQSKTQQLFITSDVPPAIERDEFRLDFTWPVLDNDSITSEYGYRDLKGCLLCSNDHKGVDFAPGYGELVFAVMDAEVVDVGWEGTFGYRVVLRHSIFDGLEYTTIYAHLQESLVSEWLEPEMEIPQGQIIGLIGDTGLTTGPHLHFEIHKNGNVLDPLEFFEFNTK